MGSGPVVERPAVEALVVGIGSVGRLGRRVPDRLRRSCGRRVRGHRRRGSAARRTCAGWRGRADSGRRRTEWWGLRPAGRRGHGMRVHRGRVRGRRTDGQRSKVVGHPVEGQRLSAALNLRAAQGSSGLVGHPEPWGPVESAGSGRTPEVGGRPGSYRRTTGLSATTTRRHPMSRRRPSTCTALRPWPSPTSHRIGRVGVGRGTFAGLAGDDPDDGQQPPPPRRRHLHRHHPLRGGLRGVGDSAWWRVRCGGRSVRGRVASSGAGRCVSMARGASWCRAQGSSTLAPCASRAGGSRAGGSVTPLLGNPATP